MLKFLYSLIFIFTFQFSLFAQPFLDIGIKGSSGWNFLINSNILDDDSLNHQISFGYSYGGKFGFNFTPNHQITIDGLFNNFRQKFEYVDTIPGVNKSFHSRWVEIAALDLLIMYRNNLDEGSYFEIGPQFSFVQNSKDKDLNPAAVEKEIETNEFFNPNFTSFVLGFGGYVIGTEYFSIGLGLRFKYSPFDLLSEKGKANYYPKWKEYDTYKSLTPLTMELVLEFDYEIYLVSKTKKNKNCRSKLYVW